MRLLIFLLLLTPITLIAQRRDSTFFTSFATTGIISKTNETSSYLVSNALRFSIKKQRYNLNNNISWVYGEQKQTLVNNDVSAASDFNFYPGSPKFYYWGLGTYDKSFSLKINNRGQAGLGVAYSFIDNDTMYANISNGILYETSNLKLNDSTNAQYSTFRNSLRLRGRYVFREIIELESLSFWQPSLQNSNDYNVKLVNSVTLKLRKWLGITSNLTYNKINRINRENLLLTFGLKAHQYF